MNEVHSDSRADQTIVMQTLKCSVCGLINPPESSRCDCGYDFNTQSGGGRAPFRIYNNGLLYAVYGVLLIAGVLMAAGTMGGLNAIVLLLLISPHVPLGVAWVAWFRSPSKFQGASVRTVILFSGLISCSLSIAMFWIHVIWLNLNRTDPFLWKRSDHFETVCDVLNVLALSAGVIGKGRAQLPLIFAAFAAWAIWITGHIGIL
jgi:hypothetical protein